MMRYWKNRLPFGLFIVAVIAILSLAQRACAQGQNIGPTPGQIQQTVVAGQLTAQIGNWTVTNTPHVFQDGTEYVNVVVWKSQAQYNGQICEYVTTIMSNDESFHANTSFEDLIEVPTVTAPQSGRARTFARRPARKRHPLTKFPVQ